MSLWRRIIDSLRTDSTLQRRIDDEMAFHLEMKVAELRAQGMSPEAAARAARAAYGNRSVQADAVRDVRKVIWLGDLVRDVRFGIRGLRRRPGLFFTASLSLALGIAATTTLFGLLDAVALRPLPIAGLDRLYVIQEAKNGEPIGGNPLRLRDFGQQVGSFASVTGFYGEGAVLTGRGDPARVSLHRVFGDYFGVVGTRLTAGRGFSAEEQGGEAVLVVRRRVAERWFGSGEQAIGRSVTLDGANYTVIGVAENESYPEDVEAWAPADRGLQAGPRRGSYLFSVARLATDVPTARAQAELSLVQKRLSQTYPDTDFDREARLVPLQSATLGDIRASGFVLLGIAGSVLLIACLNVAGLLLTRAAERQRESAVRAALGAGARSLIRLYLAESLVIGVAGGIVGVLLTAVAIPVLRSLDVLAEVPRITEASVDGRILIFATGLVLLATFVFGTLPAVRASEGSLLPALQRNAPKSRTRDLLVAGQAAIALVLLIAAATMLDGFLRLRNVPLGFSPDRAIAVRVNLAWGTPNSKLADFRTRTLEAFQTIPGVRVVGLVDRLPLQGGTQSGPAKVVGRELPADLAIRQVSRRAVNPDYFAAMEIPIREGRTLGELGTAVVNEEFARQWLGDRPIGQRIDLEGDAPFEVVGVVGGVRQSAVDENIMPEVFIRAEQTYWPQLAFVLRTDAPVAALASTVKGRVREIDPNQVVDAVTTLDDELVSVASTPRALAWLVGSFALVAALLVAVGLYGVLSGYVAHRAAEIAVRMALGATPASTVGVVTRRGLRLAGYGIALGVGVSWLGGDLLARLPVSLRINQPELLIASAAGFLGIALVACLIPAWRAARVDPALLLRHE